jgi:hypothetical protein
MRAQQLAMALIVLRARHRGVAGRPATPYIPGPGRQAVIGDADGDVLFYHYSADITTAPAGRSSTDSR